MKVWERYVPYAIFSINFQVSTNTGYSPYFMMYGYNPKTITDSQYGIHHSLQITGDKNQ